ncbi:MAG: hypothetical protein M1827_002995 [Pycnora praestabilis]|nr:MAG: hypothetical protein M1827_002995 [Pycnora praestabilis]
MTQLDSILARLGLSQYLSKFEEEGFDTWETILDITESDLDVLGIKLGHRRKLQREIANARGVSNERPLTSPLRATPSVDSRYGERNSEVEATLSAAQGEERPQGAKRKYRRHPKRFVFNMGSLADSSQEIREDLRKNNLSFTEIAKLVGESWQVLAQNEKEPFEAQAAAGKEKYNAELVEYKKTENYQKYSEYLADFKVKNNRSTEDKRPKLDQQSSVGSSEENFTNAAVVSQGDDEYYGIKHIGGVYTAQSPGRARSVGSVRAYSVASEPSPPYIYNTIAQSSGPGGLSTIAGNSTSIPISPTSSLGYRDALVHKPYARQQVLPNKDNLIGQDVHHLSNDRHQLTYNLGDGRRRIPQRDVHLSATEHFPYQTVSSPLHGSRRSQLPPPTLKTEETTTSSVSSIPSSADTTASSMTSLPPSEDIRRHRALPLPPALAKHIPDIQGRYDQVSQPINLPLVGAVSNPSNGFPGPEIMNEARASSLSPYSSSSSLSSSGLPRERQALKNLSVTSVTTTPTLGPHFHRDLHIGDKCDRGPTISRRSSPSHAQQDNPFSVLLRAGERIATQERDTPRPP